MTVWKNARKLGETAGAAAVELANGTKMDAVTGAKPYTTPIVETDLRPGTHEIWSRATDRLGRTQPLDGRDRWNPNGYEWDGVAKVEVVVTG